MQKRHIISCDWGTSSLRLQLIDTSTLLCVAKVSSSHGNAAIFNEWKTAGNSDRASFYLKYLQPLLNELSAFARVPLDRNTMIISGMASSTVGIKEIPYADLPFNLDGSSANVEWLEGEFPINNPVLLISGVHQSDDVMRGEETQLVGIASLLQLSNDGNALFILPGTHSKHIAVNGNSITHFKTFMTGEMFELLTKHSILSHAVGDPGRISHVISDDEKHAFQKGVEKGLQSELLNALFSVRINQVKKYLTPEQNYFYLSGLLIGSELKYAVDNTDFKLVLCSSGRLLQLYQLAIECAGLSQRTITVPAETLDNAAAAGQMKILKNITSKII